MKEIAPSGAAFITRARFDSDSGQANDLKIGIHSFLACLQN